MWSSLNLILAQTTQLADDAGGGAVDSGFLRGLSILGVIFAVFVLPFLLGRLLARRFRMPTYGGSIGVVLAAFIGAVLILATLPMRLGVDIAGGTYLIYELDKDALRGREVEEGGQLTRITARDLVDPLRNRLNPAGTKELVIRASGDDQVEIIVPDVEQLEVDEIKRTVSQAGILEFRIVANRNDHEDIISLAAQQAASDVEFERMSREVKNAEGETVALWRPVGREARVRDGVQPLQTDVAGDIARDAASGRLLTNYPGSRDPVGYEKWLARNGVEQVEVLLALRRSGEPFPDITGSDIGNARVSLNQQGGYEVQFRMKSSGASKLYKLTSRNQPEGEFRRRMAILLDSTVLSAPQLNQPISENGVITGNFTYNEAEFLQKILQSGSLPAALNKTPISENRISATMGRDAINKGGYSAVAALIATAVFIIVYYKFSGLVACLALGLNLLLILASMIIIQQPLTLPGLAGLVLSVGMSVDANVLVFERIREEIARKATGRIAIRNGFDRAMTTIIDSNLTTLISAVVLYWIGTDQIRGFAITLIIGLVASMFTAVFCSRVIFEVCERLRLVSFGMRDIVEFSRNKFLGHEVLNFMKYRRVCYAISAVLMLIGIVAPLVRGRQMLDIDFNGGTTVVFVLDKAAETEDVRRLTSQVFDVDDKNDPIATTLTNVQMAQYQNGTVYKLDTSLRDVDQVTQRLISGFQSSGTGARLLTYQVEADIRDSDGVGAVAMPAAKFVALQEEPAADAATAEPSAEESAAEAAETSPSAAQEDAELSAEAGQEAGDDAAPGADEPAGQTAAGDAAPAAGDTAAPAAGDTAAPAAGDTAASNAAVRTVVEMSFKTGNGDAPAKINASALRDKLVQAAKAAGISLNDSQISVQPQGVTDWTPDSDLGYSEWTARLPVGGEVASQIVRNFETDLSDEPIWQSVSKIDSQVASDMQSRAILALVLSMVFICAYIWFRFQRISFGLAALIALVHDVLITLAFVAVSHWLFRPLDFLMIDDFKISLTMVAAFLTIIGYSLNDTIVVFDRIREVKGKAPNLTEAMVNQSVNQTLGRTLLTSATTMVAVLLLYIFGGEAVHAFSFALLIGMIVGTYSSIFIAAPILLWFAGREERKRALRAA